MTRPAGEESLSRGERAVLLASLRELTPGLLVMTVQHHLPRLHQHVEMALVQADRLTATERAMASTVRGRPGRTHGGFN